MAKRHYVTKAERQEQLEMALFRQRSNREDVRKVTYLAKFAKQTNMTPEQQKEHFKLGATASEAVKRALKRYNSTKQEIIAIRKALGSRGH